MFMFWSVCFSTPENNKSDCKATAWVYKSAVGSNISGSTADSSLFLSSSLEGKKEEENFRYVGYN